MYRNLEDIDFEDTFDGSVLDVSMQEEVGERFTCSIRDASFFFLKNKRTDLKLHFKTHLHSIARSAHNISHLEIHQPKLTPECQA